MKFWGLKQRFCPITWDQTQSLQNSTFTKITIDTDFKIENDFNHENVFDCKPLACVSLRDCFAANCRLRAKRKLVICILSYVKCLYPFLQ